MTDSPGALVPDDYRREPDWYRATVRMIELVFAKQHPDGENTLRMFEQFGWLGYSVHVYPSHIGFLRQLNQTLEPVGVVFDPLVVRRWRLVNQLIIGAYEDDTPRWLKPESTMLASFAGYPILEDIARRVSGLWDDEGWLLHNPPEDLTFRQLSKSGGWEDRKLKKGRRIVQLSHKLELMRSALPPAFRTSLVKLDRIIDQPAIQGAETPGATLFERLQYARDVWSHGQRWEGEDAIWISLLLALLYFRLPPYVDNGKPGDLNSP